MRNKNGEKFVQTIIVGVLIFVVGSIILEAIKHPNPIPVVQENEKICPSSLYFGFQDTASFKIKLKNVGQDGNLFVTLNSQDILSKSQKDKNFNNASKKYWFVDNNGYADFDFEITQINKEVKNISINVNYGCEEIFCIKESFICEYKVEPNNKNKYLLKNE